ncbi:MAG TPA: hypothetical protein VIY47_09335 [Ignavibacteriaceae bacterium]
MQKQQELPYISVFKMGTGEEFIAKVVDETPESYSVQKPFVIVANQQGLQFAPFLMMGDPEKPISIPKPVIKTAPSSSFQSQYEQATSSIVLPRR